MSLTRGQLAAYAVPALPMAAMYFPIYVLVPPFYATELGLSVGAIGAVLIAIRLFDAVSDPVMGWLSDRTPGRFGRRRPWMALATPVVMLAILALMMPGEDAGIGWFAWSLLALTLGWTAYLTPYYAWGAELSGLYEERSTITIWRESFGLVGTILAALLYGIAEPGSGLRNVALFVAVALPFATLWALRRVGEPPSLSKTPTKLSGVITALREEAIFRRLLYAYIINGSANALPAVLFLFFVEFRLGGSEQVGGLLLVLYFGAAVAAAPFWLWAAARFEKHRIWCLSMLYACLVFTAVLFLREGDILAYGVIVVLSGASLGADLSLPPAIQADVVDLDTARSGQQRTGALFAIWSIATKASVALMGGVALLVLEVAGFSGEGSNGPGALWTLTILYAAVPIALKLWSVWLMWRFPLDRAMQADIRARAEA
ncbi:MAG: MFS transporter [Rubricella sp.]